jgi:hypothetical protein
MSDYPLVQLFDFDLDVIHREKVSQLLEIAKNNRAELSAYFYTHHFLISWTSHKMEMRELGTGASAKSSD